MAEFTLDYGSPEGARLFNSLDAFTQGYVKAMFFTEEERLTEDSGKVAAEAEGWEEDTNGIWRHNPPIQWSDGSGEDLTYDSLLDLLRLQGIEASPPTVADLAPETLAAIKADCDNFRADLPRDGHGRTWLDMAVDYAPGLYGETQAGRDFWYSRNGHGTGFWDRHFGPIGDRLDDAAESFRRVDLYRGDDGRLYLS